MREELHRTGRILLADNSPETLAVFTEYLESLGYCVLQASSYEQARQMLSRAWVHLALLDLRLTDDSDDKDQSGLLLAQDDEFRATPMIIVTGWPTWEAVRGALSLSLEGRRPAVNFIGKEEGLEALAQAVAHAFENYVRVNYDLILHTDEHSLLSFAALAQAAAPETSEPSLAADLAEEMEDLWRRLFYEMEEVHLDRLLLRRERCAALRVFVFPPGGNAEELIVIVGPRETVAQEAQRFELFTSADVGPRGIRQADFAETHSFAGIAYAPLGGDLEETELFSDYYRATAADELCRTIDDLFRVGLSPWHQQPRTRQEQSLNALYRQQMELGQGKDGRQRLETSVEKLCEQALSVGLPRVETTRYRLHFHLPGGECLELPHPAIFVFPDDVELEVGQPTLCGVNHGAVECDRILVDSRSQQAWLLDFSCIGPSPVLYDYLSLEFSLVSELLATQGLLQCQQLMDVLLQPTSLSEPLEPPGNLSADLRKAVRVVGHLRGRAATVPGSDLEAYYLGLIFQGVRRLAAFQAERRYPRQKLAANLNVLFFTALIGQWLEGPPEQVPAFVPEEAKTGLWVDEESRTVWVEGRQISLSRTLYELLILLYRRAGQVCDRDTIAREVFKVEFFDPVMEESRINPLIGRLRKRVEPDPSRPRYILTHHGVGYVLHPGGRGENG